ncbi:hypothetical protein ACQJBY_067097 [Aegilops geniculata]
MDQESSMGAGQLQEEAAAAAVAKSAKRRGKQQRREGGRGREEEAAAAGAAGVPAGELRGAAGVHEGERVHPQPLPLRVAAAARLPQRLLLAQRDHQHLDAPPGLLLVLGPHPLAPRPVLPPGRPPHRPPLMAHLQGRRERLQQHRRRPLRE